MELFFLIAGFFGHMTFHRKGPGAFLASRFMRLVVPFMIGWFILKPLIVSAWIMGGASLRGDVDVIAGLLGGIRSLATLPAGIFTGSHLWFLYYLVLVTVAVLALRALLALSGTWRKSCLHKADAFLAWLAGSPFSVLVLAVPTAAVLWFMTMWGVDTPDQTLRPHVPVLLLYGGFFVVGWMLHRNASLLESFARLSFARCLLAGIALAAVLKLVWFQTQPGHPQFVLIHVAYAFSYAVVMWSLVFLTIGIFQKLGREPHRMVRYIADSSYWLYLLHLPVVVWLQVAVAELPLHWSIKLTGVSVLTVLIGLLTYDLFVRSTFIGQVLNGRRRERALFRSRPPGYSHPTIKVA
jgi:hypothetical protein